MSWKMRVKKGKGLCGVIIALMALNSYPSLALLGVGSSGGGSSMAQEWTMRAFDMLEYVKKYQDVFEEDGVDYERLEEMINNAMVEPKPRVYLSVKGELQERNAVWSKTANGETIQISEASVPHLDLASYYALQFHEYLGLTGKEINLYHISQKFRRIIEEELELKGPDRNDGLITRLVGDIDQDYLGAINRRISYLERKKEYSELISYLAYEIRTLARKLHLNEKISMIETVHRSVFQERYLETVTSSSVDDNPPLSMTGPMPLALKLEYTFDKTEMELLNPEVIKEMPAKDRAHLERLQSDIKFFVESNFSGLLLLKTMTFKLFKTINHFPNAYNAMEVNMVELQNLYYLTTFFDFKGVQKVSHCKTEHFIEKKEHSKVSLGIPLLLDMIIPMATVSTTQVHPAKTVSTCNSEEKISSYSPLQIRNFDNVKSRDVVSSYNPSKFNYFELGDIDKLIKSLFKPLMRKLISTKLYDHTQESFFWEENL